MARKPNLPKCNVFKSTKSYSVSPFVTPISQSRLTIEITKVDSTYVSAYFVSDGEKSKRLTKIELYCYLLDSLPNFALYVGAPRYYTFDDLCQFIVILSKNTNLPFDLSLVQKYINTPF